MGDWSAVNGPGTPITIGAHSDCSIGGPMAGMLTAQNLSTWPAANLAIFIPFRVYQIYTAVKMSWINGTVSGNIDVGIYDAQGDRLVSLGSTAMSGASAIQTGDITDTTLKPGLYYMAMAVDNTTATFRRFTSATVAGTAGLGLLQQATAFALPSTATFAACGNDYIPGLAITGRSLI